MNQQSQEWLPIPQFEGYQINQEGKIRSSSKIKGGSLMKTTVDRCGYEKLTLSKNGKRHTAYVHRLVALTFLDVEAGKSYVNHKNGIKTDNNLENLEWVTPKENSLHAFLNGLVKHPAKSHQQVLDNETGLIYDTILALAKALNRTYTGTKKRVHKDERFTLLN